MKESEIKSKIEDLEQEMERLQNTELPPTDAAMDYYMARCRDILRELNNLKRQLN